VTTPGATSTSGRPPETGIPIEIEGLSKAFHGQTILDGLSVAVAAGSTVALIGPSGGGKSTLLRCLNGLAEFDAGRVRDHSCDGHGDTGPLSNA